MRHSVACRLPTAQTVPAAFEVHLCQTHASSDLLDEDRLPGESVTRAISHRTADLLEGREVYALGEHLWTAAEVNVGRIRAFALIPIGPFKDRYQANVADRVTVNVNIEDGPARCEITLGAS